MSRSGYLTTASTFLALFLMKNKVKTTMRTGEQPDWPALLPARASEQGNVIGLVSVYIYIYIYICHQKKIVIERTRDLNYLKFVATDFSPKTISPSAGENSGDLA